VLVRTELAAFLTMAVLLASCRGPQRPAEDGPPSRITADVVYGHKAGMALTYDVVRPEGPANGAGVLHMVSGGWISRWRPPEEMAQSGRFQIPLDRGFTVFFVRHGSSPRFKVPEAVADVRLAVSHVRAHASAYGVDPDRLGLTGASAGGHLSLSVGLRGEGPDGTPDMPVDRRPNHVAAIVAFFPPVDLRRWVGPNDQFPALEFDPALADEASPILFVSADDPPTLLLHGDADQLVPIDHSERLEAALDDADIANDLVVFPGAGHGFQGADAERSLVLMADWFERYLIPGR
jgi:acetyl esterase/lipase